ncbi:hypothetical protein NDU88_001782 [Pleurodeles waltl]|uniref:Uncharacterized protein n=1 Tax=Pleurodeles waltl TaxID=8319 RepID=A0AAV7LAI9_PLEWA|nr:hypothetical protein NDU88_001782 [Pleurodeles waltl]
MDSQKDALSRTLPLISAKIPRRWRAGFLTKRGNEIATCTAALSLSGQIQTAQNHRNMNQTALASLISKCVLQLLEKSLDEKSLGQNLTEDSEGPIKPYDNAYFFILFVMLFYSFLALTVFFGYVRSKKQVSKKDPYQEFIEDRNKKNKWNTARPVEKYEFEEECVL